MQVMNLRDYLEGEQYPSLSARLLYFAIEMHLDSRLATRPKYRPEAQTATPDLLINFELTQENAFLAFLKPASQTLKSHFHSLANDDDLVYSDNQAEISSENMGSQSMQSPLVSNLTAEKATKVLSDCINLQNVKPQHQKQSKQLNSVNFVESELQLLFKSRTKTEHQAEQTTNKSSCFLTNRSVFFTSQTSRSNLHSIRFNIKPKATIKQIAQNAYKTERIQKSP